METKIVYLFDDVDRVFTHPYEAQESPEEAGFFIEPVNSCPDQPPATQENEAAQRNVENTAWSIIADFRGHIFYDQTTGEAIEIVEIGQPAPNLGISPPLPSAEEVIAAKIKVMDDAIKVRLNTKAGEMRFDNIASAIAAASLPAGEYRQADGAALHLWSARTWQKAEQIRDAFLAGERPEPTWTEVESELPTFPIEQTVE
ncbi:hypothetical protein DBR37_01550 [Herminiimonas sp. KBW02]|uniref:hypothetical protein n=1 Tax=Herminiimonas sp. KBW02 TaxID=2153363 RepID=UPI000F5B16E8|nr:hypothetical protein [Herminiimonas sp. KBW02]RQO38607.1 hypothetical protein DBR37_01550 [Herminiimonas sp. KBW02]